MAETRRMHHVPRVYLEKFAVKRGKEYHIATLPKGGGKIFHPNITNVCIERDLYMMPGETEQQRQQLENIYNDLFESKYSNIYNILIDKDRETLTADERFTIIGFVVSTLFRNYSWHKFHNQVTDDLIEKGFTISKENGVDAFFFEDREISVLGKKLEDLQKEMRDHNRLGIALVSAESMFPLIRMRMAIDIVTVVKAKPGYEFLTSDNPVTFRRAVKSQHANPFDPNNTLSIPIDHQHLLQLRPWRKDLPWQMLGRTSDVLTGLMTSSNNIYQHQQCERFLMGSQAALEAYQALPLGMF